MTGVVLWPIIALRKRINKAEKTNQHRNWLPRSAKIIVWLCALIHLAFILLILSEPSFELFLNTGYEYEIPTFHLTVNWLLIISAGLAFLMAQASLSRRCYRPCGEFSKL